MLELIAPRYGDMQQVWAHRNEARDVLRTRRMMPFDDQERFFREVICDRNSPHHYFSIYEKEKGRVVGFGGLTDIDYINSRAEISLLIFTAYRGRGYGRHSVNMLVTEAFNNLGLHSIYGECYFSSPSLPFWRDITKFHLQSWVVEGAELPCTNFRDGKFNDSFYFTIINTK